MIYDVPGWVWLVAFGVSFGTFLWAIINIWPDD